MPATTDPGALHRSQSAASRDVPDNLPNVAETYRRKIERLTEALSHPDDAREAADAIREVIDRIIIMPGKVRGG